MINENIIEAYHKLFIIRNDVYAVQQMDSRYIANYSMISVDVLSDHIEGKKTIGTYTLSADERCKWICYDFDDANLDVAKRNAVALSQTLTAKGIENILEFSGMKGYHVWIFFNETDSHSAYHYGKAVCNGHIIKEMFPKQETHTGEKKLGNLVKLPLGIHKVSNNRSVFLNPSTFELMSFEQSLQFLQSLSNRPKKDIPKVIVEKVETVKLVTILDKTDMSDITRAIIDRGQKAGSRHKKEWFIATDLYLSGWNEQEIVDMVLLFNKNCDPPKNEDVVRDHLKSLFANPKDYIEKYGFIKEKSIESALRWVMKREQERIEYNKVTDKSKIDFDQRLFTYVVAQAFIHNIAFKTTKDTDELFVYNKDKGIYESKGAEFVNTFCEKYLKKYANINVKNEVIAHIKHSTYIERDDFNADKDKICLKNGILDLTTLNIEEFSEDKLFTVAMPVKYDVDATCVEFEAMLKEKMICQADIDTIQEYFGFCLLNDMRFQKALLLYGPKRSSKSTTLSLIEAMIGKDNVSNMTLQFLNDNNFSLSNLYGKKANICADLPLEGLRSISAFMLITGEDQINADVKNSKLSKFMNIAKPIFSCNQIPRIPDYEPAFFRRWILLEFPHETEENKRDENLKKKLTTEENLSGILNWSIVGLKRLLVNHKFSYRYDEDMIVDLWRKNSDTISSFILNCIIMDDEGKQKIRDVYKAYENYCKDNKLRKESIQKYGRNFKQETGATEGKLGLVKAYCGIKLKSSIGNEGDDENTDITDKSKLVDFV